MAIDLFEEAYSRLLSLAPPPLFMALAARAYGRGIAITVQGWLGSGEPRGEFATKDRAAYGFTDITIRVRYGRPRLRPRLRDHPHAILLAHEMGHHLAWHRKEEHPEYSEVAEKAPETIADWALSAPERARMLLDAEARAWAYAHDELRAVGFTNWARFARVSLAAFGSYACGLYPVQF